MIPVAELHNQQAIDELWSDNDEELSQPSVGSIDELISDVSSNFSYDMDLDFERPNSQIELSFTDTASLLTRRTVDECLNLLTEIRVLAQPSQNQPNLYDQLEAKLNYLLFINGRQQYRQRIAAEFVDLDEYNEE